MPLIFLESGHVKKTGMRKLSDFHKYTDSKLHTNTWKESEVAFLSRVCPWPKKTSPSSYSLNPTSDHGEWSDLVKNLPKSGMAVDEICYPLQMEGGETILSCSKWLTPSVEDAGRKGSAEAWEEYITNNRTCQVRLRNQVMGQFPTPSSQLAGEGKLLNKLQTKDGDPAKPGERAYNPDTGVHVQINLNRYVQLWPTQGGFPSDGRTPKAGQCGMTAKTSGRAMDRATHLTTQVYCEEMRNAAPPKGQLNPTWTEWLMGFPLMWSKADSYILAQTSPKKNKT